MLFAPKCRNDSEKTSAISANLTECRSLSHAAVRLKERALSVQCALLVNSITLTNELVKARKSDITYCCSSLIVSERKRKSVVYRSHLSCSACLTL